jgi:septal ring factor EnvC (AmiA/AmiB activator)
MKDWSREDLLNKINKLEDELKESKRLNTQNRNKINRLEADLASIEDYSDKQAQVIKHYFNQIKELVNGQR